MCVRPCKCSPSGSAIVPVPLETREPSKVPQSSFSSGFCYVSLMFITLAALVLTIYLFPNARGALKDRKLLRRFRRRFRFNHGNRLLLRPQVRGTWAIFVIWPGLCRFHAIVSCKFSLAVLPSTSNFSHRLCVLLSPRIILR